MAGKHRLYLFLIISLALFLSGCAADKGPELLADSVVAGTKKVYRGTVAAKSKRTDTLSIRITDGATVKVGFDDRTRGLARAVEGVRITVNCKVIKGRMMAVSIKKELSGFAPGVREITAKEVKKLIDNRDEFILIDSRSEGRYRQAHLPKAISLPACEMDRKLDMLPEEKDQLLVFYCGGKKCGLSTNASAAASRAGYKNIRVMLAGIEGWAKSGYPTYADDEFVVNGDALLIDLRSARKNTVQRIPGSVSMPAEELAGRIDEISKKVPVIVYSDNNRQSLDALAVFRESGFSDVSMVKGNFQGWKKRKQVFDSGSVITRINWSRKIAKGEVAPAAFIKAQNQAADAVILDVRTSDEAAGGKLKSAKLLPLNDLYDRFEELPKNKKIYIYSATGARAQMAGRLLRENGYDAYFLVADIRCEEGKCSMSF